MDWRPRDGRATPLSGADSQRGNREQAAGRSLSRDHRGNSDPLRIAAARPRGAPGAPPAFCGGSGQGEPQGLGPAVRLHLTSENPEQTGPLFPFLRVNLGVTARNYNMCDIRTHRPRSQ
ncbi:uncharacterized protein LOC108283504 [Cebus imitator]|uniref:uncharacterized protein LOC108283504 n=1 Tax=Cebus imitator TaxID=2715852 RepID=UPI000809A61D|nr:uncharacterized protein LOC108283504 [Cebus imitator]